MQTKDIQLLSKHLKELTNNNDHSTALFHIAQVFKLKYYETVFAAILKIRDAENSLPADLAKYQHSKYKDLMQWIKDTQTDEIYKTIHQSL